MRNRPRTFDPERVVVYDVKDGTSRLIDSKYRGEHKSFFSWLPMLGPALRAFDASTDDFWA